MLAPAQQHPQKPGAVGQEASCCVGSAGSGWGWSPGLDLLVQFLEAWHCIGQGGPQGWGVSTQHPGGSYNLTAGLED